MSDHSEENRADERLENLALISATLGCCDEIEDRCRLAIHHFKHRPLVRMYTDDLRRLCWLAQQYLKGNR